MLETDNKNLQAQVDHTEEKLNAALAEIEKLMEKCNVKAEEVVEEKAEEVVVAVQEQKPEEA